MPTTNSSAPIPTPPSPPTVPLDSVNTLINETWQFFSRHAGKLVGITAALIAANIVLLIIAVIIAAVVGINLKEPSADAGLAMTAVIGVAIFAIAFSLLSVWTGVTLYFYIIRNDAAIGVWAAYRQSWPSVWSYLGTSLLVGLITLGGLLLLIVPGLYWGLLYSFAPLIVLAEGKGVLALARSKSLVKGNWWAVFWRNFVFGLLILGLSVAISFFFSTLFNILGKMYEPLSWLSTFGQYFATLLTTPLNAVFMYRLYLNLRRAKGETS